MSDRGQHFKPIMERTGHGYAALTIYAPGEFMPDMMDWSVFVGGCGIGDASTEADAKAFLLAGALRYCTRQIDYAEAQAEHYTRERQRLLDNGLEETARPYGLVPKHR